MNPVKIEIGQYKEVNKGSLKAFFSIIIYPEGQKILDCRYFVQGDSRWFSFPQKEIKYTDGRKNEYIPYVSYLNKEYLQNLKELVLNALKDIKPKDNYGQNKNQIPQNSPNSLPGDSSSNWF